MANTVDPIEQRSRELAQSALDTLADVMRNGDKDAARVAAANAVLDRGYGRPTQAVIAIPQRNAISNALAAMTDAELLALIGESRKARGGGDAKAAQAGGGLETACDPLSFSQPLPAANQLQLISRESPAALHEFPLHDPLAD